ncbi:MAG: GTPase Era [Chitinivibrionales bacterium]|nr:GTPase Era [Chitinivibrionales bacterium]
MTKTYHSAFIALIGRPNCGKSTLLNTVLEEQLSIVTSLPQTTRRNLKGIYTDTSMQLVFIDTPGIHQGKHTLNEAMIEQAGRVVKTGDADILCYIVDLMRDFGDEEASITGIVSTWQKPCILVFNKKDLCTAPDKKIAEFMERFPGLNAIPFIIISANEKSSKTVFLKTVRPFVPEGPRFYPGDDLTDENLRFFAAEYLRRCIIQNTRDEIPHACFIEVDSYKEKEKGHFIETTIHVETRGQRGILVGKGGALIAKIRRYAESDMKKLTGVPAYIKCHIKVTPRWRNNSGFLRSHGYEI